MTRVRGLETEYGLQLRVRTGSGAWRRLSSEEASQLLFEPVVAAHRATNVFLRNGGRLYLDVGSHPEYATAECTTLRELLAQDRAGDAIVAQLAAQLRATLAEQGREARISVFKNNVDSHHNSYGSHENFQVARGRDEHALEQLVDAMTPFLATRQLLCGAGHWQRDRLGRGSFLVSQRAEHMWDPLGTATTRNRPMVNTRDEPHADASRFRRLHVIVGDSTMLDHTTLLRIGSTELVLRALEAGVPLGTSADLATDAGRVVRAVAQDITGRIPVLRKGTSAVAVQRRIWQQVADLADDEELRQVHQLWGEVLDAIDDRALDRVADRIDWVAKRRLLLAQHERHHMALDDPRLAQLDLAWHDIVDGQGLARLAEARGQVRHWLATGEARAAVDSPPATTRAVLRAAVVTAAQAHRRDHSVDWMTWKVHDLPGGTVVVDDPLVTVDERVDELVRRMAAEPRRVDLATRPAAGGWDGLPGSHSALG